MTPKRDLLIHVRLQAGRTLRSAGEAARFVGLIEYERLQTLGATAGRSEVWADLHTVLASRKGDVEEHSLLLCSLLLGLKFEAFCAIGSTLSGICECQKSHEKDPRHTQKSPAKGPCDTPKKPVKEPCDTRRETC